MSKVAFNLIDYAKQNNLKLVASAKLKDGSSANFLVNENRIDCFILDANKKIIDAKGAKGSEPHLFETLSRICEKLSDKIQDVTHLY